MYAESIGAIGSQNPAIAAFLGQSFHTAEQLGLNATYPAFVSITSDTMKALTSPFPVVDVSQQRFSVTEMAAGFDFAPGTAASGISGKGDISRA
jgi:hypothetical protein